MADTGEKMRPHETVERGGISGVRRQENSLWRASPVQKILEIYQKAKGGKISRENSRIGCPLEGQEII